MEDKSALRRRMRAASEGWEAEYRQEADAAIDAAAGDPEIGILLISEPLAALCQEKLIPLKAGRIPLVVEIPSRGSTVRAGDSITRYIREAIGVKL